MGPDPGKKKTEASSKAYSLLVKILNEANKVGIGKVLREKEHLIALRAYQRGLVMHQLRYLDEIRPTDEIGNLDSLQKVDSREISVGKTLVENLTTEKFDPGQYSDSYAKELEKLIEAKSKGRPPPPLRLSEFLVSIPICVNHPRYRINPAAINAIIAVNVLYHEDAYNKNNPVAMLAIPM